MFIWIRNPPPQKTPFTALHILCINQIAALSNNSVPHPPTLATRCPERVQSPSKITQLCRDAAGKPPDPRLLYDTLTLLMIILHSVIVGHCYGYSTMVQHFAFPFSYSLRPGNHICCLATVLWEYHNLGVTTIKDMMALAYPEGELAWRVVGYL